MDENHLIKMAIKGNDDALYQIIHNNKDQLYRIAFSYLKSEDDSLEAIQETTFRAYKNIKKLKNPSYFKTWLIRILINYCINEQKRKIKILPMKKDSDNKIEHSIDDKITVEEAVENLKPKYKEIIVLKYFEDLTISEISDVLSSPEGTIKTRLSRALKKLRNYLNKDGEFNV